MEGLEPRHVEIIRLHLDQPVPGHVLSRASVGREAILAVYTLMAPALTRPQNARCRPDEHAKHRNARVA